MSNGSQVRQRRLALVSFLVALSAWGAMTVSLSSVSTTWTVMSISPILSYIGTSVFSCSVLMILSLSISVTTQNTRTNQNIDYGELELYGAL